MKIKLFTHNDLDGVSCGVLAKLAFGDNADISYCNYDKINGEVSQFLNEGQYQLFDRVFITDISVDEFVANKINELYEEGKLNIKLIDHHSTAEWLNKYEWATVNPLQEIKRNDAGNVYVSEFEKSSGTSMFYKYLLDKKMLKSNDSIYTFVELVRQYDTWEWETKYKNENAKQLNDLLYILGRERFIKDYLEVLVDDTFYGFSKSEKLLLELEKEKIDRYIKSKAKQLEVCKIAGYDAGVVFAEQYQSQLGNELSKLNPNLDFIAMINMGNKTVSYRTQKDDIHLGEIAKLFGGGGHAKAAGSQFDEYVHEAVIGEIFNLPNLH